jgi:ABC-2 type transport system permease protein
MTGWLLALRIEFVKVRASRVVLAATSLTVVGIAAIVIAFRAVAASGDPQAIAKLGEAGAAPGWPGLLATALQVAAAAYLLGITVVHAWLSGREFADGTVVALYALSVGRGQLATAKLVLGVATAALMGLGLAVTLLAGGLALGYGVPDSEDLATLARIAVLAPFSALAASPVALAATLGRGLLPGVATGFVLLAAAQVLVVVGVGDWFPLAVPALWALNPDAVVAPAVVLALAVGVAASAATALVWRRLQLDR